MLSLDSMYVLIFDIIFPSKTIPKFQALEEKNTLWDNTKQIIVGQRKTDLGIWDHLEGCGVGGGRILLPKKYGRV